MPIRALLLTRPGRNQKSESCDLDSCVMDGGSRGRSPSRGEPCYYTSQRLHSHRTMNWKLLAHSALVAGSATLGTALAGFAAALCLMGLPARARKFFFGGTLLALMVPP